MAGGSGTRLWPLSRAGYPKQFLVLGDSNQSLFQEAAERLSALAAPDLTIAAPLIVGNEEHLIARAPGADRWPIVVGRHGGGERCTNDRFRNKGGDAPWADTAE